MEAICIIDGLCCLFLYFDVVMQTLETNISSRSVRVFCVCLSDGDRLCDVWDIPEYDICYYYYMPDTWDSKALCMPVSDQLFKT